MPRRAEVSSSSWMGPPFQRTTVHAGRVGCSGKGQVAFLASPCAVDTSLKPEYAQGKRGKPACPPFFAPSRSLSPSATFLLTKRA